MGRRYLAPVDLNNSEIQNFAVQNLGADPSGGGLFSGRLWFNSNTKKMKYYDGSAVMEFGTGGGSVSSVTSANTDISVANQTTTPQLTLNSSTSAAANTIAKRDASGNLAATNLSGTNTGDQTITLTGEATGTGTGSFAVTLSNSAVIAKALTGLSTASGGAVTATDSILTAFGRLENRMALNDAKVTGSDRLLKAGDSMTAGFLTLFQDPSSAMHAVTKQYVDNLFLARTQKLAARVAAPINVNLAAPGTSIDGITLAVNDRFLAPNQSTASQNGLYIFNGSAVAASRCIDADSSAELVGMTVDIIEGATYAGERFMLTTPGPITVGTTSLTYVKQTIRGLTGANGVTYSNGQISLTALTANRAVATNASGFIAATAVTDTELGYLSGVTSAIQTQISGKEPTITAGTAAQYWKGTKVWATLDTLAVTENTNLYFTNARAIAATLTGFSAGAGTVTAADSILTALQKLQGTNTTLSGTSHTQHTDTGTTSATFQIQSGSSGPKLKNNGGVLEVRNAGDTAYADLTVANLTVKGTVTQQNSTQVNLGDNEIVLNNDITTSAGNADGGIAIKRLMADNTTRKDAKSFYSESAQRWQVTFGAVAGTLQTKTVAVMHTQQIGDGAATSIVVTHNLNNQYAAVHVHDTTTGEEVFPDITAKAANTATLGFAVAPTSNQYTVTVIG